MSNDLLISIEQIVSQKDLPPEVLIHAIESALLAVMKKRYGSARSVSVKINEETGEIKISVPKKVVEIMHDYLTEIPIEEAQKIDPEVKLGDLLEVEVDPRDFGRIDAQKARQILVQKLRDAERENIYAEYKEREGELVWGVVQRIEGGNVIVDLERAEGIIPRSEQVPKESYMRGDQLKCYVIRVDQTPRGPLIILSRTHPGLVGRLFETEVPEIEEGLVRIVGIVREPGERSKVAVLATEENIDPVGTFVGIKGSRVQAVVRELRGEKIDILEWSPDPEIFVANALSPAKVSKVVIDEESKIARVVVPDDQLSLAIGKRGQNARLAAKLTGWKIDIKSESQMKEELKEVIVKSLFKEEEEELELESIDGIGPKLADGLQESGFDSVESIAHAGLDELAQIPGIGAKTAERIKRAAMEMLGLRDDLGEEDEKRPG
jgi:N utilization substance protein A